MTGLIFRTEDTNPFSDALAEEAEQTTPFPDADQHDQQGEIFAA